MLIAEYQRDAAGKIYIIQGNGVTAEMAIRLEKAGWGSAESWLRNQVSYDLWQAKKRAGKIKVKRCPTPEPV